MSTATTTPHHRSPPITPELWERLRKFDRRCTISFTRSRSSSRTGNPVRSWHASIRLDGGLVSDFVIAERATFADAVHAVIEEAERRGWAR